MSSLVGTGTAWDRGTTVVMQTTFKVSAAPPGRGETTGIVLVLAFPFGQRGVVIHQTRLFVEHQAHARELSAVIERCSKLVIDV